MPSPFTLAVGDWTLPGPDQEVTTFRSVEVSDSFDEGSDLSFDVLANSAEGRMIQELSTDVWLYRSGALIARCRVVAVNREWSPDGDDVMDVAAVGYKRMLNARHFMEDVSFSDVPQADVVWGSIQHTQAQAGGDMEITAGTLNSGSQNRTRPYEAGDNIGQRLAELSAVINGPWWDIDPLRRLQVAPPSSFPVRDVPIMLGATAREMRRRSGSMDFANAVFVDGDDEETTPVIRAAADIATDPRGRWEKAIGFPSVTLQATLIERADGAVLASQSPVAQWSCEIEPARYLLDAGYKVGDFVTVVVPARKGDPNSTVTTVTGQVMWVTLRLSADGELTVRVEVIES